MNDTMRPFFSVILVAAFALALCSSESTTVSPISTGISTTTMNHSTTTGTTTKPEVLTCAQQNSSCATCTNDAKCYWCGADSTCNEYPALVPKDCKGNKWYWKQCLVPGYILIIVVPSVCGVFLLAFGCCIYCCCCRRRGSRGYEREESRIHRRREETRQRNEERKSQRKERTDAIRQKYGLLSNMDDENEIV